MHLNRFIDAQDGGASHDRSGNAYEVALKEIMNGAKVGHWIWFVFPQGPFGESDMSQRYAINNRDEARGYLQHKILRNRLTTIAAAVAEQLEHGAIPEVLMGSDTDCFKLASSMTLFHAISQELGDEELSTVTQQVLKHLTAVGWGECSRTLAWLTEYKFP